MNIQEIKQSLINKEQDARLLELYMDDRLVEYNRSRYVKALDKFSELFGERDVELFSAPGRSEVGGNHTDHQHGEVLAASINLDAIAVVEKTDEDKIVVVSDGFPEATVDLTNLELVEEEKESTLALVKGVTAGFKKRGYKVGGFRAYVTSDVLIGAGLSSSAAFETLMGTILSHLYNEAKVDAITIAMIGQYAENVYFGKPCGLMDQMACSVGNLVHIDFANPDEPIVEKIDFDMAKAGYSLCITDTKGSHADLTADYAAVPAEMKSVAAFYNQEVLLGITLEDILKSSSELRAKCGDRAVLRAIHFIEENKRVRKEVAALKAEDTAKFLKTVKASGDSSFKFLQNVYSNSDVSHQNVSLALAVSEIILGDASGVCRVHGGGFAGTIQAFVKNESAGTYMNKMNELFGADSCKVLKIRKYGGVKIFE